MWYLWILLAVFSTGMIVYFLYTIVFCFWFIYLVDGMKRKRRFYKTTLRCVQGDSDPHQQILAHNARTELVKFVSLFCLNLVDWIGFTSVMLKFCIDFIQQYREELHTNHSLPTFSSKESKLQIPYFDNLFAVITLVSIGSLCMYLSARYTQIRWINSKNLPYCVCFFLFSSIITQSLLFICDTHIIGLWCDKILVTLSVIFAWRQYRKLNMVFQWSIVDLRVSGNIVLLEKHVRMKRRFNRLFTVFWIGVTCLLLSNFISIMSQTAQFILRMYYRTFSVGILCGTSIHSHLDSFAFAVLYSMQTLVGVIGYLFSFVPYIGYGLCTMYVVLWMLVKGKTAHRTHFPVQSTTPLI